MVAHEHNTKTPHIHLVPKDPVENLRFRRWVLDECRGNPRRQAQFKRMCREDPLFYANVFVWMQNSKDHAAQPVRPFISHPYQDEAILTFLDCVGVEDLCIVKSRDVGGTAICIIAGEYLWHWIDYQSGLLCSRKDDLVDKTDDPDTLFARLDFIHKHQPTWMLPTGRDRGEKDPKRTKNHLKNADNQSVIDGEATVENLAVGGKRAYIALDERALMERSVAISTGTSKATNCRISNSTPRGTMGDGAEFYRIFKNPHIRTLKLCWWMHPEKAKGLYTSFGRRLVKLDPDYEYPDDYEFILDGDKCETMNAYKMVEGVKRKMRSAYYDYQVRRDGSEQITAQEEDMDFLTSGWSFFSIRILEELKAKYGRPPSHVGELSFDITTLRDAEWRDEPNGRLSLWCALSIENRLSLDHQFVIGVDIATGRGTETSSNSVLSVFDKTMGEKVAEWVCRRTEPSDLAKQAVALGYWLNNALIVPEENGPGQAFIKVVLELGYPNLWYRNTGDDLSQNRRMSPKPGWHSNKQSKRLLLEEYGRAIRDERFPNPSLEAMKELGEYNKMPDGTIRHSREKAEDVGPADSGDEHGDRVIADALAWRGAEDVKVERAKPVDEIPLNCFAARQRRRQAKRKEAKRFAW